MPTNTHVFETRMSKRMQASFINKPVFRSFVNQEEQTNLINGQSVTRPYRSLMRGQTYTRNGSLTFQNIVETNETLTINTIKSTPFQIDDFDAVQSNFPLQRLWTEDATDELKSLVDGDILAEVANASNVVDNADFGGTSGDPISLDTSNVFTIFNLANRKLQQKNIDVTGMDPRLDMQARGVPGVAGMAGFGVISPYFNSVLAEAEQNRETPTGDRVGVNGYQKTRGNMDLMLSNNSYFTAVLMVGATPTNGDTIVINGVTFTFVSSIGTTAGNVLIGASAAAAIDNLVTLVTTPGTTTATGVALSNTRANQYTLSDREKIEDITVTDGTTSATVTAKGADYLVLSDTLTTTASNYWTKETQHLLMGKKGCVDMVSQVGPDVKTADIEDGFGVKVKPRILYGKKSFLEGTFRMVAVKINTASLL